MNITIKSGDELNKLLDALAKDIVDANIHYKLFIGLINLMPEYSDEVNLSNTFWSLTLEAIKEAYMLRLCRIYEQYNDTNLNLVNLLHTIKSNLHFFQEPHFGERLKNNPFVKSLAKEARIPSVEELQADIEFASEKNPVVHKLMLWRHNFYAHKGAKIALGKSGTLKDNSISENEIELLIDKCFSILNKYMSMYKTESWSRQALGHDDYLSLFKFLRIGLEKHEADIQQELNSWSTK